MSNHTELSQHPETLQHPLRSSNPKKLLMLVVVALLVAVIAGTGGYLLGRRHNQSIPLAQLLPSPQNATAWKLYTNKHGYTIQYPANYGLESVGVGGNGADQAVEVYFYLLDHNEGYGRISVVTETILNAKRNPNESLQQYLERSTGRSLSSAKSIKNLHIDGHEAVQLVQQLSGDAINIRTFIFIDDNHILTIEVTDKSNDPNASVYYQMLSSLKFIPTMSQTETTGKLYTNNYSSQARFSLQYPANYSLECADRLDLCKDGKGAEQSSVVNFYPPKDQDNGYGSISVFVSMINTQRQQNESLDQYLQRSMGIGTLNRMSSKNLLIDGHEALQITEGEYGKARNIRTYILSNNSLIEIYFTEKKSIGFDYITPIINYPNVNVYYQMLSSFKFIPIYNMSAK